MFYVQGADGKEYGPAPMATLRNWVTEGRLNAESKVRRDGQTEWLSLGDVPEFRGEAAPAGGTAGARSLEDYGSLSVMVCFEKSWELFSQNAPLLILSCFVFMVLQVVGAVLPVVGIVVSLVTSAALNAGLSLIFLKRFRGEPSSVSDLFAGFSSSFKNLLLLSAILGGLSLVINYPLTKNFEAIAAKAPMPYAWSMVSLGFGVMLLISFLYMFASVIIIDRGVGFWKAMEMSRKVVMANFFRLFAVGIVGFFVAMLGVIALFVGLLVAYPIVIGAWIYAYLQVTRDLPRDPNP